MPSYPLASRFRRLLLYVVEQLGEVSVTKLQKVLYLAPEEPFSVDPDAIDPAWLDLCATHGVRLAWPGTFDSLAG